MTSASSGPLKKPGLTPIRLRSCAATVSSYLLNRALADLGEAAALEFAQLVGADAQRQAEVHRFGERSQRLRR